MKKIAFLILVTLVAMPIVNAQTNQEEIDLFQSIFGMEKKAMVADFIKVDGAAGEAFWSLYDQYEAERKSHGQKRIALMVKYAENYATLDDVSTEEILNEMIALGNEYDKLILKYYKAIKKASGVKTAAQFYQIEGYFQSAIRLEILSSIPFIGELDI